MDFKNIENIDELIKESEEHHFTNDPSGSSGQGAAGRLDLSNSDKYYPLEKPHPDEVSDTKPDNNKDPEYAESKSNQANYKGIDKFAQEDVELLNGEVVDKGELIKWYYLIRANMSLIQEILDKEEQ